MVVPQPNDEVKRPTKTKKKKPPAKELVSEHVSNEVKDDNSVASPPGTFDGEVFILSYSQYNFYNKPFSIFDNTVQVYNHS